MLMVERSISFNYQGEEYQTWYKVAGDLSSRTWTPLVVAHGGPGLSHDYLLPLSDLATKFSIPVIFYDQIGNSGSTHLPSKPLSFWTIDLFLDELVNLLKHFHIQSEFDLLGHSWGGILGLEFEIRGCGTRRLRNSARPSRMMYERDWLSALWIWKRTARRSGCSTRSTDVSWTRRRWPEELVYSMNQSSSPSADISVAVGMFAAELRT